MPSHPSHFLEQYRMGDMIGEGRRDTKVYEATDKVSNKRVAIKVIQFSSASLEKDLSSFRKETAFMKAVSNSEHCISALNSFEGHNCGMLVMEIMRGDLMGWYLDRLNVMERKNSHGPGGGLSETEAREIFVQIVKAVKHGHDNGIIHRDIKPENIFIADEDDTGKPKLQLGDWGLSAKIGEECWSAGTIEYIPPEVLDWDSPMEVNEALDVWSLGVLLYVLVAAKLPFRGNNRNETAQLVRAAKPKPLSNSLSVPLRHLISRLLDRNPQTRITMDHILTHQWINPNPNKRGSSLLSHMRQQTKQGGLHLQNHNQTSPQNPGVIRPQEITAIVKSLSSTSLSRQNSMGSLPSNFRLESKLAHVDLNSSLPLVA